MEKTGYGDDKNPYRPTGTSILEEKFQSLNNIRMRRLGFQNRIPKKESIDVTGQTKVSAVLTLGELQRLFEGFIEKNFPKDKNVKQRKL